MRIGEASQLAIDQLIELLCGVLVSLAHASEQYGSGAVNRQVVHASGVNQVKKRAYGRLVHDPPKGFPLQPSLSDLGNRWLFFEFNEG